MATAKHRAIDLLRRNKLLERKHEELGRELEAQQETAAPDLDAALDDDVGDDLLRLVFIACHPVLSTEARVALTLRLLGGLTTDEIARAFLVSGADDRPAHRPRQADARREAGALRGARAAPSCAARLSSVLEVIYLVFNEGYSATAGDDWMRPALCEDALRLGRILAELAPEGAGGPRSGRADGDPGVALPGAGRARRESRSCCSIRTARAGISSSSVAVSRRSSGPRSSAGRTRPVRAAGRDRRLSRPSAHAGGDGLGAHRGALRRSPSSRHRPSWS